MAQTIDLNNENFNKICIKDIVNEVLQVEIQRSTVFDQAREDLIPQFRSNELVIGRLIGRGGFCVVHELIGVKLSESSGDNKNNNAGCDTETKKSSLLRSRKSKTYHVDADSYVSRNSVDDNSREQIARRVWSKKADKLVVKQVDPAYTSSKNRANYVKGIIDLALETKYLASLSHRHIINLRGICRISSDLDDRHMIIVDHLRDLLNRRLTSWMHRDRATKGMTGFVTRGTKRAKTLLTERLLVAYDIAEAMDYLHSKRIIYRDLKPDNIGFGGDDIVKIFDFGLAKELRQDQLNEDGLYCMTGLTGALRYMAPEVGLNQAYNLKADVYSFTMMLWYILSLEPPLGLFTHSMFVERVFQNNQVRPCIYENKWSPAMCNLIRRGWSPSIAIRPSFKAILGTLRKEIMRSDPDIGNIVGSESSSSPVDVSTVTTTSATATSCKTS